MTEQLRPPTRRTVLTAGGIGLASVVAAGALVGPRPATLGEATGDGDLTDALAPRLDGHRRVSVAVIDDGTPRFAGFGADENREFEIGSVTKTFTAALVMDAADRGELTLDSTVQELLGERAEGSPIADVTITELATHTSGLPALAPSLGPTAIVPTVLRKDPYRSEDVDDVIDAALTTTPSGRGEYTYSNLGTAFEGHLLAEVAGSTWQDLLITRQLEPLGLAATSAPTTHDDLPADAPSGHSASGLPAETWTLYGYAPAGCVRSTSADMATYLQSMIDGTNAGAAGIEPLVDLGGGAGVGIHWHVTPGASGGTLVWHNGMTGGFSAFCGWNQETGRGVVMLSDTARYLDDVAIGILDGEVA